MRMILQVKMPNDKFNAALKDGTAAKKMQAILEETKPEAAYFCEVDGHRTAILVVNISEASKIPFFAEPWFLQFNAQCELHPVMSAEDLGKSGIEAIAKKWA